MNRLKHPAVIPVIIFILLITVYLISVIITGNRPVIESIEPSVAYPGDTVEIRGSHFGPSTQDAYVIISGIRPTVSSYLEWSDNLIRLRIPDGIGSGKLFVKRDNRLSNGHLFTNREHIPVIVSGPAGPGQPYIDSITPEKGMVGDRIDLAGVNFGTEQGSGRVLFSFFSADDNKDLPCSALDFDYIQWSDHEISVYVPDGATSGSVRISTDRGESNSIYFEVSTPFGTKRFNQRRGYQLQYGVTVSNVLSQPGSSIQLWIPVIQPSLTYRNVEYIYEPEPVWENYRGLNRYNLENIQPWNTYNILLTYWVERMAIETDINAAAITGTYDEDRELYRFYTRDDGILPSSDSRVRDIVRSVAGSERNPYLKAKNIYLYLLRRLDYVSGSVSNDPLEALDSREATAYDYAALFTAMVRNAGIPARLVAGFMVYGDKKTTMHWWAEFYIKGLGWLPVDPAMGDDMSLSDLPVRESNIDYYFGNIGSQHIGFSHGIIDVRKINPDGIIKRKARNYSIQTIHEEISPGVETYRADWNPLHIIDWW